MKKYLRATQLAWMVMAILAAITTIYMIFTGAKDNAIFCLMITLFCGVMWNMRRMFNNKLEREARKRAGENAENKQ